MKNNLTLILMAAAVLGLYVVSILQEDFENSEYLFSEKVLSELQSISLSKNSNEIFLTKAEKELHLGLEKNIHPGQWFVSKPSFSPPNIESLNKLFSILPSIKSLHNIDSAALPEYGLENSQVTLTLNSKSGSKVLKIGATNPISKRRYAQIQGSKKIALLNDAEISGLLKLELRDLRPLQIPSQNVTEFSIVSNSNKKFTKINEQFSNEQEKNLDPKLLREYLENILNLPAWRAINLESLSGTVDTRLDVDWLNSNGALNHTEIEIYADGENFYLKLPGAVSAYEYGPELGRLLNKKLETFIDKKVLREIVLEDFFSSCRDLKIKDKCFLSKPFIEDIQQSIQRVEVLDLERLPGRLMTPTKPECRLKLESSKVLFEIGAPVNGDALDAADSPRFFVSDVGADHYKGVISSLVANDFCKTIEKLCSEARAKCAG